MKFAFTLKNKVKIAFLLFCIMCCLLLIRFLEDKSVKMINESFISMYHDRLVPATDLYYIAENLYHKSNILQNTFSDQGDGESARVIAQLNKHNSVIDSVISKYQLTMLVKQEQTYLNDLKYALNVQQQLEHKATILGPADGEKIYDTIVRNSATQTLEKLSALIKIQSKVGDDLIKDSKVFVSGTKVYSALQVFLAIVIGIMIVSIVAASNVVKIESEKFNLN